MKGHERGTKIDRMIKNRGKNLIDRKFLPPDFGEPSVIALSESKSWKHISRKKEGGKKGWWQFSSGTNHSACFRVKPVAISKPDTAGPLPRGLGSRSLSARAIPTRAHHSSTPFYRSFNRGPRRNRGAP